MIKLHEFGKREKKKANSLRGQLNKKFSLDSFTAKTPMEVPRCQDD